MDAGANREDRNIIEAGRDAIQAQYVLQPDEAGIAYMLGTAQTELANADFDWTPRWAERRRSERLAGRRYLAVAAKGDLPTHMKAMAWINLGNDLYRSARSHEAFTAYKRAIEDHEDHPVAAGWLAQMLFDRESNGKLAPEAMPLAHHYAAVAKKNPGQTIETVSASLAAEHAAMPSQRAAEFVSPVANYDPRSLEGITYALGLALNFELEGLQFGKWDEVGSQKNAPRHGGDDCNIVAMVNMIKADFIFARKLVHDGLVDDTRDAKLYFDTEDGARYGAEFAKQRLGLRAAV